MDFIKEMDLEALLSEVQLWRYRIEEHWYLDTASCIEISRVLNKVELELQETLKARKEGR